MPDLAELKLQEGHVLELRFKAGFTVRARLIDVDPHSKPPELIYDPLEVLEWGPLTPGSVHPHATATAAAIDLESWTAVRVGV
jgi:hypothetical protein